MQFQPSLSLLTSERYIYRGHRKSHQTGETNKKIKMAQMRNEAIVVVIFAVAMLLQSTEAEDYTVGGSDIGWTSFPPGGASFYSNWASNLTFKVNDNLVFNFESGSHSVAEVTKANYDKCDFSDKIQAFNKGPATITLDRTGDFYFTCTFSGHCTSGQKLMVKVKADPSSPVPTGIPPAEGPSSPTGPAATSPPPQTSATPLTATFSLLLIIAFNFLSLF